jgi:predicted TIM-barrel fold metal-dependent hydrolase
MSDMRSEEWMISVDDHLVEPRNVWSDRLPAKYRDLGPRWVSDDKGEAWLFEESTRCAVGGAVTSGAIWPPEARPLPFTPLAWSEIPPACHDPKARIDAMNTDRVLAALMFPNLPGFAGNLFQRTKDKELALLCLQAYNDWLLDEWCASHPGRFIGLALVPMWDARLAAAEAERAIGKGARAIAFSMAPHNLGFPPIHDAGHYWDPLFAIANEANLPLCTHLGTGLDFDPQTFDMSKLAEMAKSGAIDFSKMADLAKQGDVSKLAAMAGQGAGAPMAPSPNPRVGPVLMQLAGQTTLVEWLYSGNFDRFPNLKIALSENGIGWIPSVLTVADWLMEMSRTRVTSAFDAENNPLLSEAARNLAKLSIEGRALKDSKERLPSEVFHDHIYGCFIHDPVGLRLLEWIGVDNVMIETDFPHNATYYPNSMQKAQESLAGLPDDVRHKILRGNAERVFQFTPAAAPH